MKDEPLTWGIRAVQSDAKTYDRIVAAALKLLAPDQRERADQIIAASRAQPRAYARARSLENP